jgi:ubiquitin-activating enzyme E1
MRALERLCDTYASNHLQAVVCTDTSLEQALQYNEQCRSRSPPVAFIYGKTAGVFGQVFCDFGDDFAILDTDGMPPCCLR